MKKSGHLDGISLILETVHLYNRCCVAQASAALAYFLLLTLFPLLLCVNYFVGMFRLDLEQVLGTLGQFFPQEVLAVVQDYLSYASRSQSGGIFLAAVSAIVLSASAGLRTLLHTLDRMYGRPPGYGLRRVALSVALSALFLLAVYLSAVIVMTGGWFFQMLERRLPRVLLEMLPLSTLSALWLWIRYVLLFCFMLLLVLPVYWVGSPKRFRGWFLIGNAMVSAGGLVVCSAVFSWFVGLSSRYSLLYGSLASIIILVMWLYFCGNILLLGAAAGWVLGKHLAKGRGNGYNREHKDRGHAREDRKDRGTTL